MATAAAQSKWDALKMLRYLLPTVKDSNQQQDCQMLRHLLPAVQDSNQQQDCQMQQHLLPAVQDGNQQQEGQKQIPDAEAAQANPNFVDWSHEPHIQHPLTTEDLRIAADDGNFSLLRWAWENEPANCLPLHELFQLAVNSSDEDTLEWMVASGHQVDCEALTLESAEHERVISYSNQIITVRSGPFNMHFIHTWSHNLAWSL